MVTIVRFIKLDKEREKGMADILINGIIRINGVKLFNSKENVLFVKMPEEKVKDDYKAIVEIMDLKLKQEIINTVLEFYKTI